MFTKRILIVVFVLFSVIVLIIGGCTVPSSTPTTYTITSNAGAGGQINPEGEVVITEGDDQTFTITPDGGYQIADVLVDGASEGPIATHTFQDIQQNHTIQAIFEGLGQIAYNTDTGIDYDTIQKAIDAAGGGETIIVYSGIYEEKIKFNKKNITVRSTDPLNPTTVAATVIDGGGSGTVVQFVSGDESTLEGFTIRNGNSGGYGGGIFILSSDPIITGNTITDNTAHLKGGGIFISFGDPTITGNTITGNMVTTEDGGGIFMSNSNPVITGNTITYNEAGSGGGINVNNNSSPTITGNTITYNEAGGGGGVFIDNSGPVITGNTIEYNKADAGGGINVNNNSSPTITGNTITYNYAGGGGGIYVYDSSPIITGNTIEYNKAGYGGGGILVYPNSNLQPDNFRPAGWGTSRENIPTGATLDPAQGEKYTIAGNEFLGNKHSNPLNYTEGAHVYFN